MAKPEQKSFRPVTAKSSGNIPLFSVAGDFVILNSLFVAAFYAFSGPSQAFSSIDYLTFYLYLNFTWSILILLFGAHQIERNSSRKSILFLCTRLVIFFFFLFLLYFQITPLAYFPRSEIKYLFILFFILLISWKLSVYYVFLVLRKKGHYQRKVIIVGFGPESVELSRFFSANVWSGYRFLGFFDGSKDEKRGVIGDWQEIKSYVDHHEVDEIFLALHRIPQMVMQDVGVLLSDYPGKVRVIPELGRFSFKSAELISYGSVPVLQIQPGPLSYWYNRLVKRVFDVILSLVVISGVVSWMSVILYILSIPGKNGGLFFTQKRTGIDGKEFTCIKYRTMRRNRDAHEKQAVYNDERVTPTGRILRKLSLDELPQFLNVLAGQMSVVGPRPHMLRHTEEYRHLIQGFMLRHTVKPGITGLAQVNGFRGEIKNMNDLRNRVESDVSYVENWSINLDLRIIAQTLWVLVRGQKEAY